MKNVSFGEATTARSRPSAVAAVTADPASAKAARLTYIDGARGYLLSMMYLAHSATTLKSLSVPITNGLRRLHHHQYLAVWDAEFFIPLSGFVCALAYLGVFNRSGWTATWRSILKRLRWVYLYQIIVAMTIVLLSAAVWPLVLSNYVKDPSISLPMELLSTLTFINQPRYLDILLLYIVLMLGMPFGFALLVRRRYVAFAAILIGLWAISDLGLDKTASTYITTHWFAWQDYIRLSGVFSPFSWAVLFYAGFFLGYQYKSRGSSFSMSYIRPNRTLFFISIFICVAMVIARLSPISYQLEPKREDISWQSFVVVGAVVYNFYYLFNSRHLPVALSWLRMVFAKILSFPPLVLLGQNSLFVYSVHVIVVALVGLIAKNTSVGENLPAVTIVFLSGYLLILSITWLKRRYLPTLP